MPNFHYKAVTLDGEPDEGEMFGPDAATIIRRLQDNGRIPILAEEIISARKETKTSGRPALLRRSSRKADVASFTRSLSALLGAGTPLDRGLAIMLEVEDDEANRQLISDIQTAVRGGAALSTAMEEQGKVFSVFYMSMIRAAEISGTLSSGLERMVEYLERSQELRDKLVSALIYPAILLGVAGLSVIILLAYVVPQFRPIFDEMGSALPLATYITLAISDFLGSYWWLCLAAIATAVLGCRYYLDKPRVRYQLDGRLLRLPLIGRLISTLEVARFSRSLGTLLQNGVPVLTSLSIARETLSNRVMSNAIGKAGTALKQGGELSDTMIESKVFPSLAIQLTKVGEETGNVDSMMLRIADVYDREVATTIQRMLALLEPLLIVGLGIVIAGIIMSILVGIISINDLPM